VGYSIAVRLQNASVIPSDPIATDLYEDRTIVFTRARPVLRGPLPAPPAALPSLGAMEAAAIVNVNVVVPPEGALTLKDVATGNEQRFEATARVSLSAGRYLATMAGKDGRIFSHRELELAPGKDAFVNLLDWKRSLPHVAIASRLPEQAGLVDFSESLGKAPYPRVPCVRPHGDLTPLRTPPIPRCRGVSRTAAPRWPGAQPLLSTPYGIDVIDRLPAGCYTPPTDRGRGISDTGLIRTSDS